jgi:hypothetical protein
MKTYVLTVSRYFPKTHKRAGEETNFTDKIMCGTICPGDCEICDFKLGKKIHTIRSNYPLWSKRISEIQKGNAILSIRYWSGKPYNSKQVEIYKLDKDSGIGIQSICIKPKCIVWFLEKSVELFSIDNNFNNPLNLAFVANNDGLSIKDFKEWFKSYDLSKPMAIIHFTAFRYFS